MASTIITKNSSTASAVPVVGDLTKGELAVNVTDKKVYTKDSSAAIVKLVGSLGNQEASAVAITGGSIAGITDLAVADGGTGSSTAAGARSNLSAAASGANSDIISLSGLTTALSVAQGGTGITSFGSGVATFLGTPSSANLLAAITDETGTGALVFANSPTLVTPALGTPASGNFSTGTFTWPTFNQNTTGTAAGLSATLAIASGGTGATTAGGALTSLGAYPASNPSGYTSNTGTVTSVGGTGTVNGLTLTGTVTTSGNLTLGGTLDLSSPPAIGGTTAAAGSFTTVNNSGGVRFNTSGSEYARVQLNSTSLELMAGSTTTAGITLNSSNVATLTNNPVLTAGTANGVTYLNGSKVLTSGSALTFDGSKLSVTSGSGSAYLALNAPTDGGYASFQVGGTAIADVGSFKAIIGSGSATDFYIGTRSTNALTFGTNFVEAMRLTSTGLGIGTSSPVAKLHIKGTDPIFRMESPDNSMDISYITSGGAPTQRIRIGSAGGSTDAGLTVLNSGNVGIGTSSPATKLTVYDATTPQVTFNNGTSTFIVGNNSGGNNKILYGTGAYPMIFYTNATEAMRIDSSQNVGIGVTPSASNLPTIQSTYGIFVGNSESNITSNAYYNSGWKYVSTAAATEYRQGGGAHQWYTAPSGTAGDAISFTQAMTLDASGNLLVGATSTTPANVNGSIIWGGTDAGIMYLERTTGTDQLRFYVGGNRLGYLNTASSAVTLGTANYPLVFATNDTERARITSGGYFKASNEGTYYSSTGAYHEFRGNSANSYVVITTCTNATPLSEYIQDWRFSAASPNDGNARFWNCEDSTTNRAYMRSNGGLSNYQANDTNLSDRREKTNFAPAKSYLDTICAIPVQTFNYIDQNFEEDDGLTLGVVAQDVQAVAPELVTESNWGTEEEPKMRLSIYQTDLQYALMKALQELKAEFDAYKASHP